MNQQIRFINKGTLTSVQGFQAGATFAGMKTYAEDKLDIGLVYSKLPCVSGGVFTTNRIKSPSIVLTQEHVRLGAVRVVAANSGIANTSVGEQGMTDAKEVVRLVSAQMDVPEAEVAFLSTGIIGVELPMALIRVALPKIQLSPSGGNAFARAIMTTDTRPKEAAVAYSSGGRTVTIGGVAKGSGMIHPDMATMLSVLATDASVEASFLQRAIKQAADRSFNMVSVDGDTSTNDTLLIMANGAAGGAPIQEGSQEAALFQEAVTQLSIHLAKEIVRDGEGASKLFEVIVQGARNEKEARMAARTIASSNLVKTAVHGNDPNWGRIIGALGRSGAHVREERLALYVNDVCLLEKGVPIPFFKDAVVLQMRRPEVSFRVHLHLGDGRATAWGCDLSEAYVTFNSAYTT
ncbi:MAG: bifunctional glutamate N-acetyltransferase/amino-acid acetyltransferase ArgJ [Dehalococcoidia bacterium]|nr:bifunctional glutamate N-acetyltransferase/amino-acid acetyltransferase ArgJ [Dehalococcoidia bacterium]